MFCIIVESKISAKMKRTGVAYLTICDIIRSKNNGISQDRQSGSGKRSVLSTIDKNRISNLSNSHPKLSSAKIRNFAA